MPRRLALPLLLLAGHSLTPAGAQDLGRLTVQGGLTAPLSPSEGPRLAANASLSFVLDRLALGPEVGWYFTGSQDQSASRRPENVISLGAVGRFDLGTGLWRPYVAGSVALHGWESARAGYPTGTTWGVGGALGLRSAVGPIGFLGEARLIRSLGDTGLPGRTLLVTTAGVVWRW